MNARAPAAAAIVVLGLGFGVGRWASPSPPTGIGPATTADPEPAVQRSVVTVSDDSCEQALATTQRQLAMATGILEAQVQERVGVEVPFPDDLPVQYTATGFEDAVEQALADCPDAGIALAHVDCSEFPCMAFFSQPGGTYNHGVGRLRSCDSWTARFDGGGQANASFMSDDGPLEYSAASPRPAGTPFDDNFNKRWKLRLEEGEAVLMEAWGGREATPLEKLEQSLDFFYGVAEGQPEMEESTRTIIVELEAQRDALLAEGTE